MQTVGSGPIPQGWEMRMDPRTGCPYFVNHPLKISTYIDPRTLPPGWEIQKDRNGQICFFDHFNKTLSYSDPRKIIGRTQSLPIYDIKNVPPLPPGWEMALDESGRVYYIDHNSKKTTYTHPIARRSSFASFIAASQNPQNCSGYLSIIKKGKPKRRWFFFKKEGSCFFLCYSRTKETEHKAKSFFLPGCECNSEVGKLRFRIKTREKKKEVMIEASSQEEKTKWVKTIGVASGEIAQVALQYVPITVTQPLEVDPSAPTDSDENLCKICFEVPVNCVLDPCGHQSFCIDCSHTLRNCAICRKPIHKVIRVYKC